MKNFARAGCLARSLVYFLVGVLALLMAVGNPWGATTDESGVMRRILDQPFGHAMLFLIALGLFSYSVWRIFQSVQDHDEYRRTASGMLMRTAFFMSGLVHSLLGFYALNLIFSFTRQTAVRERVMAKWVLMQPMGRGFLMIFGMVIAITGFMQFLRAFNGAFLRDLRLPPRGTLVNICRFGLVSRGVVFVIIGSFFIQAAWKYRSREAGGLSKAWETLRLVPYGNFIVGLIALGFIAFSVFGLIEGFYRKRTAKPGR